MGEQIRVNFSEPIVPVHYQGKSRCLSAPIHDFMVAGRVAPCMNSNQDNEPLGEIADDEQPSVLNDLALEGTRNVMRRFNRNTMVVAIGLLGTVIFAALVLAVQEHLPRPAEVAEKAMQTSGGVMPNVNPVGISEVAGLGPGKSTDKISSEQATSIDDGFTPEIDGKPPCRLT